MNSEKLQQLMIDRIRGELSPREEKRLSAYLADHPEAREELKDLEAFWSFMDHYGTEPLSGESKSRIAATLPNKEHNSTTVSTGAQTIQRWAAAAGVLILLGIGYLAYLYLFNVPVPRDDTGVHISLVSANNSGTRIQAVQAASGASQLSETAVKALIGMLNEDPDRNVRLMVLEILSGHLDDPTVKTSIVRSIPNQDAPHVQLAIIHMVRGAGLTSAVPYLKKLQEQPGIDGIVRNEVKKAIEELS